VAARGAGYPDAEALWRRSELGRAALERLAAADALRSLALDRRQGLWALKALGEAPLPLFANPNGLTPAATLSRGAGEAPEPDEPRRPPMPLGEHVVEDYATTSLSLKRHPLAFLRGDLAAEGIVTAAALADLPDRYLTGERRVRVAGLVLIRQRPGSAK